MLTNVLKIPHGSKKQVMVLASASFLDTESHKYIEAFVHQAKYYRDLSIELSAPTGIAFAVVTCGVSHAMQTACHDHGLEWQQPEGEGEDGGGGGVEGVEGGDGADTAAGADTDPAPGGGGGHYILTKIDEEGSHPYDLEALLGGRLRHKQTADERHLVSIHAVNAEVLAQLQAKLSAAINKLQQDLSARSANS